MVRLLQLGHTTRRSAVRKLSPEDSPAMCRQRRRRRIEMRQSRPNWPPVRTQLPKRRSAEMADDEEEENDDSDSDTARAVLPRRWRLFRSPMPSYSEITVTGLAETSHVGSSAAWVQEDFCSPDVFSGGEALHFFAVYDGRASPLYEQLMHRLVAEELERVDHAFGSGKSDQSPVRRQTHRQWWNDHLLSSLRRSFERMATSSPSDGCGGSHTTAAVAILTAEDIFVACCGGGASRVVLYSDGVPIPLCRDLQRQYNVKPKQSSNDDTIALEVDDEDDDDDEIRGYEVLQVSLPLEIKEARSPSKAKEVEIFMIERSRDEDECMILATHGIWDVMSDKLACDVANNCLRDSDANSTSGGAQRLVNAVSNHDHSDDLFPLTTGIDAATLMCRLAIGRGSSHGISVVVVDMKSHSLL